MSKDKLKVLIVIFAFFVIIGFIILVGALFNLIRDVKAPEETEASSFVQAETETTTFEEILGYEAREPETEETFEAFGEEGDADYFENDKNSVIFVGDGQATRNALVSLAIDCNGYISYSKENSNDIYRQGFVKSEKGANYNPLLDTKKGNSGMNQEGYVTWLFRNTFGSVPDEFNDLTKMYQNGRQVAMGELEIGDIGLSSVERKDDTYQVGVCIGYKDGVPIFTHMSPIGDANMGSGRNYLSYLKEMRNENLDGAAPVDLRYFVRPNVRWNEE